MTKYKDGVYATMHNYGKTIRMVEIVNGKLRVTSPQQGEHWFYPEFFFDVNRIIEDKSMEKSA